MCQMLCDQYTMQARDVRQFTMHAHLMRNPHFLERLLRMADEEQNYVLWLCNTIQTYGGEIPHSIDAPKVGWNEWACLRIDEEQENHDATLVRSAANSLQPEYPDIADQLQRMCEMEKRHREEIRAMLSKSNPDGLPVAIGDQHACAQQKQAWLLQQKMAWFDQRRAQWEADGKPEPWAEWLAQQEIAWTASELPTRELQWLKHWAAEASARDPDTMIEHDRR